MRFTEYLQSNERPEDLCREIDELRTENQMLKEDVTMFSFLDEQNKKEIESLKAEIENLNKRNIQKCIIQTEN